MKVPFVLMCVTHTFNMTRYTNNGNSDPYDAVVLMTAIIT